MDPATGAGTIVGTLHYMSPEQIEAQEADARSDIFSFGLVFYELITGKRAFDGTQLGQHHRVRFSRISRRR